MTRTLVPNAIAALFALPLFTAPAAALPEDQAVFTNFEDVNPNTNPGDIIVVGSSPDSADLGGDAFGGRIGNPSLYHSGVRSWMVVPNGTGVITFETDADIVEFYARVLSSAAGDTVITAFDAFDVIVDSPVTVMPGTGWQLVSLSGGIARIDVMNLDGAQMNGIDDFGFTTPAMPTPIPTPTPTPPPPGQSGAQQKCIKAMNGESVKVGDAQGKESIKCEKFAARGITDKLGIPPQTQTAQACLTNDVKGKVQKKVSRLADRDASKCLDEPMQLPDFGYVGTLGAGLAVLIESVGLTEDLFGPDLDAALVLKSQNKVGAKCQEVVHSGSHKVFKVVTKEVQKSADNALRGRTLPQAYSASTLSSAVWNALEADTKNKIAKAASRLADKVGRTCQGDLASLFPGACSGSAGTALNLAQCANEASRCRACKAAEGFAALTLDCETFDNGLADSSCQAATTTATPTATP